MYQSEHMDVRRVPLALLPTIVSSFMFLDRASAEIYAKRWAPQTLGGSVFSTVGIHTYTKARIELKDEACSGALLSSDTFTMFILTRDAKNNTRVSCVLWDINGPSLPKIQQLQRWHYRSFKREILCSSAMNKKEQELWFLSLFDS